MPEFSDDILVEFALGMRDDRTIREAVGRSPELGARLRALQSELRYLEDGLNDLLAQAAPQSALPSRGWRILLAVDDSPGARRAAATAGVLARMAGEEVEVLHVRELEPCRAGPASLETSTEAAALVDDVVTRLREGGVTAVGEIQSARAEKAATRILAEAEAQRASLIVMSSRPMTAISALLCRSVSRGVLRHATCPVLIVR
jgi:nucleotide-binding universal stress UspA family protein